MVKVHIVFNAHLDPVWLWSWRDGLDEVLNTSHYICNLLDRHPDIVYTRGEAWVYEQVKKFDPVLFERIRSHIKAGRWSTVGGWYLQPDCNQPSGFALERQISIGQRFFRENFGEVPAIGYNVDSFGHAATFPGYLRAHGQSSYVMMRPGPHEMTLPARLFRWRGYANGPEVTTFRIAEAYCTPLGLEKAHILSSATDLPEGITHTMCFIGIGDHGGGPTESMIEWCRENKNSLSGVELEFSSPKKFFAAIQPDLAKLPLFTGELQMHAVGCYSVHRPVKTALRKAEHKLVQAETVLEALQGKPVEFAHDLEVAWKQVCFHHFHDTLGGTCLPSAYEDVQADLGRALAIAEEIGTTTLRRHLVSLPADPAQRIVLFNASELPFSDYVEMEPWLEWSPWQPTWQLVDEENQPVPFQTIDAEAPGVQTRLFFRVSIGAKALKILRIVDAQSKPVTPTDISVSESSVQVSNGASVNLSGEGKMGLPLLGEVPLPQLALYDDPTDTWAHGIKRFPRENRKSVDWQGAQLIDKGPLVASLIQNGTIGSSRVQAEWRIHQDSPVIDYLLRVTWMEEYSILKLEMDLPGKIAEREDGILGGSLFRKLDAGELPLRDWTRLRLANEEGKPVDLAIVAPEVYALDGTTRQVGFTLLRSPQMAWHEPHPGKYPRGIFSDRGEHFFRFRFIAGENISAAFLDQVAFGMQRPPLTADWTRGMKNRAVRNAYAPPPISNC
jgi:alpha-mannosidase